MIGVSACSLRVRTRTGSRPWPGSHYPGAVRPTRIRGRPSMPELSLDRGDVLGAVAEQGRRHHDDVRADHECLDDVGPRTDARTCRQRQPGTELRPKDRDPAHGQPHLPGLAQLEPGHDLERFQIEIGLIEAIEQHEAVGAGARGRCGEVREGRVVRAELDGQRDRDRGADGRDRDRGRAASMSAAVRRGSAATWYRFSSSASAPASWMRRA